MNWLYQSVLFCWCVVCGFVLFCVVFCFDMQRQFQFQCVQVIKATAVDEFMKWKSYSFMCQLDIYDSAVLYGIQNLKRKAPAFCGHWCCIVNWCGYGNRKQHLMILSNSNWKSVVDKRSTQQIPPFFLIASVRSRFYIISCLLIVVVNPPTLIHWNAKDPNERRNHRYKMINATSPARSGYLQNFSVWTDIYLLWYQFELVFSSIRFLITHAMPCVCVHVL